MLFNSFQFLIFFIIVLFLYWRVFSSNPKAQNLLILVSSYVFYGWWDWRFLSLIIISTLVDYTIGHKIHNNLRDVIRKRWLWLSIVINLGLLGFFKYYNFFVDSFAALISSFGYVMDTWTLNVILPVGISFYTFQSMSYSIDIYRNKMTPTRDLLAFSAFVSFFPQLVAGPIERAGNLLPQMMNKRSFDLRQAKEGGKLILLGLFKKVVIADQLASSVNLIFKYYEDLSTPTLMIGAIFFGFQIYADFSGYSNIARGLAKLMGFELMVNFNYPYFSRNIGEFWRRWHISLSTWFRDYVYIPLGGSRGSQWLSIRNIFIIFLVSGLWHGANWTFIAWGGLHAALFLPTFVLGKNRKYLGPLVNSGEWLPSLSNLLNILRTFVIVTISWIFFRSESIHHALSYFEHIMTNDWSSIVYEAKFILVFFLILVDWLLLIGKVDNKSWFWYIILGAVLAGIITVSPAEFIYFQF